MPGLFVWRLRLGWLAYATYPTRVRRLLGPAAGGVRGGRNAPTFLNGTTAPDDGVTDTLIGGIGLDWFLAAAKQDVVKKVVAEIVTPARRPR